MPDKISQPAFAKVNLGLEVLRKRPDGYHDIETIFYRIQLADQLEVQGSSNGVTLECDDPRLPVGEDNLCIKAVRALQRFAGVQHGAHIVLRKRIPTGAGLGGGSSDAATVLTALNRMWDMELSIVDLQQIAATIGSDVPGFLAGPLTFGQGRGEILEELPPRFPYWLVCVTPPAAVSTAWAYSHVRLGPKPPQPSLRERFLNSLDNINNLAHVLTNDFESSVLPAHPEIALVKRMLTEAGCSTALMSGSGSSVFGLALEKTTSVAAAERFPASHVISLTPPLT